MEESTTAIRTSDSEKSVQSASVRAAVSDRYLAIERTGRASSARGIPPKSLEDLGWPLLMAELARYCHSERSAQIAPLLPFLETEAEIQQRLDEGVEALELARVGVRPGFFGMNQVEVVLASAAEGNVLEGVEFLAVSAFSRTSDSVADTFEEYADVAPQLADHAASLQPLGWLAAILEESFDAEGQLKDTASDALGPLRQKARSTHARVRKTLKDLLTGTEYEPLLQDQYFTFRDGRYVFPVKAGEKGNVTGIVHGRSGSGQTFFIEPTELVELNNQLTYAQMAVEEEEQRILRSLTLDVAEASDSMRANMGRLVYLDLTLATGRLANDMRATRPEVYERGPIDLRAARHPMLAMREFQSEGRFMVVPNDIRFGFSEEDATENLGSDELVGTGRCVVISGPNTGGKTVTLKTLGLFALMIRAGLLIPADEGVRFPIFSSVFADIGDDQSIAEDLSSFSAHVRNIVGFTPQIGGRSLVLLDELFNGTDPAEGAALSVGLLEELLEGGATVAVTTHSQPLKHFALASPGFVNASMGFDMKALGPTYVLRLGTPGASHAIGIARRLGLAESILTRAQRQLDGGEHLEVERMLADLDRQQSVLRERERTLKEAQQRAEAEARRHQRELARLKDVALADVDASLKHVYDEIRAVQVLIKRRQRELNNPKARRVLTSAALSDATAEVRIAKERLEERVDRRERRTVEETRGLQPVDQIEPGQEVWVRTLRRMGTVLEVNKDKREVRALVGILKTTVSMNECFRVTDGERAEADQRRAKERKRADVKAPSPRVVNESDVPPQHPGNTSDFRGQRVDDAIDALEQVLDDAFRRQEPALYIIHGHGTGALKTAVRTHLKGSSYVRSFRPGERGEGGDGVTVVLLK